MEGDSCVLVSAIAKPKAKSWSLAMPLTHQPRTCLPLPHIQFRASTSEPQGNLCNLLKLYTIVGTRDRYRDIGARHLTLGGQHYEKGSKNKYSASPTPVRLSQKKISNTLHHTVGVAMGLQGLFRVPDTHHPFHSFIGWSPWAELT